MKLATVLTVLLSALQSPQSLARYIVTLEYMRILETKGDPGDTEEWRVRYGTLTLKDGTMHSGTNPMTQFYIKDNHGNDCNPSDNESSSSGFYSCQFYENGHMHGAKFCVDDENKDSFKYALDFQIGDEDAFFDNGPKWDFTYTETSVASKDVRNFTSTGSEGRKGRIFMRHIYQNGRCLDAGYLYPNTKRGSTNDLDVWGDDYSRLVHGHNPECWLTDYGRDWMEDLPDDMKLSEISMPGTHNSGSDYGSVVVVDEWVQNQNWNIFDQLKAGIRFFDIRVRPTNDGKFDIVHGDFYQELDFQNVMSSVNQFLASFPSETVLMRVKQDSSDDDAPSFGSIWSDYMDGCGERMAKDLAQNVVPELGSVRGKVVVLRDNGGIPEDYGLAYSSSIIDHQDEWDGPSLDEKTALVLDKMASVDGTEIVLNFCSATGIQSPVIYAKHVNAAVYDHLKTSSYLFKKKNLGVIIMDYPGEELVYRIIISNYFANSRRRLVPGKEESTVGAVIESQNKHTKALRGIA